MARRWLVLRMPPEEALKVVSRAISTSGDEISALTLAKDRVKARIGGPWYDFDYQVIVTVQSLADSSTEVRIDVKAGWGVEATAWGKSEVVAHSLVERISHLSGGK
jgi:hypothetical protein